MKWGIKSKVGLISGIQRVSKLTTVDLNCNDIHSGGLWNNITQKNTCTLQQAHINKSSHDASAQEFIYYTEWKRWKWKITYTMYKDYKEGGENKEKKEKGVEKWGNRSDSKTCSNFHNQWSIAMGFCN